MAGHPSVAGEATLLSLPNDILCHLTVFLRVRDRLSLSHVCRRFQRVTRMPASGPLHVVLGLGRENAKGRLFVPEGLRAWGATVTKVTFECPVPRQPGDYDSWAGAEVSECLSLMVSACPRLETLEVSTIHPSSCLTSVITFLIMCPDKFKNVTLRIQAHSSGQCELNIPKALNISNLTVEFNGFKTAATHSVSNIVKTWRGANKPTFPPEMPHLKRVKLGEPWGSVDRGSSDISFLEGASNLQELCVDMISGRDLGPLKGCVNLRRLCFGHERMDDMSALRGCTQLSHLEVFFRHEVWFAASIPPLPSLRSLRVAGYASIAHPDLTFLSGMDNLTSLTLEIEVGPPVQTCHLNSLHTLCPNLRIFDFQSRDPDIETLSGLSSLQHLTHLTARLTGYRHNQVRKFCFGPPGSFKKLKFLSLSCSVDSYDLSTLEGSTELETIEIDLAFAKNENTTLSPMNFPKIKSATLTGRDLCRRGVEWLSTGTHSLERLTVRDNSYSFMPGNPTLFTPIQGVTELTLIGSHSVTLAGIKEWGVQLKRLRLVGMEWLETMHGLSECTQLTALICERCSDLRDLTPASQLPSLVHLTITRCPRLFDQRASLFGEERAHLRYN